MTFSGFGLNIIIYSNNIKTIIHRNVTLAWLIVNNKTEAVSMESRVIVGIASQSGTSALSSNFLLAAIIPVITRKES